MAKLHDYYEDEGGPTTDVSACYHSVMQVLGSRRSP